MQDDGRVISESSKATLTPTGAKGKPLSFGEYGAKAYSLAIYPKHPNLGQDVINTQNLVYPVLGMVGEAGEVAEKIKKIIRGKEVCITDKRAEVAKEIGDVLWYVNACAMELGYTLEEIAQMNLDKLFDRKDRDVLHGEGDNR